MTKSSKYSDWTVRDLNAAIASDEGVIRKEGERRNVSVDRVELEAMKSERINRIFGR